MKIATTATYLKNVVQFADTDHNGKLDAAEVKALNASLKPTEIGALATVARVLPGRTSLVDMKVGLVKGVIDRVAEQAHFADEAGTGKGRDNGFVSMNEARAALLQKDVKSALLAFAKLANSRGEPIPLHAEK